MDRIPKCCNWELEYASDRQTDRQTCYKLNDDIGFIKTITEKTHETVMKVVPCTTFLLL
jgi:hypothetical protein